MTKRKIWKSRSFVAIISAFSYFPINNLSTLIKQSRCFSFLSSIAKQTHLNDAIWVVDDELFALFAISWWCSESSPPFNAFNAANMYQISSQPNSFVVNNWASSEIWDFFYCSSFSYEIERVFLFFTFFLLSNSRALIHKSRIIQRMRIFKTNKVQRFIAK